MAQGIGPGDAVICPSFTFTATAEVVALVGATPVFADVEAASFNLDPESLQRACAAARELGLRPRAVIPVDLFGQPADHDRIASIAAAQELFVLDDAAQAFGATYKNSRLGTLAPATAARCSPTTRNCLKGCAACAFMGREAAANMIACASASTAGSTPSKRPC